MRKRTNNAFVNEFLVYSLVALFVSGSVGLATVWMRHQISVVANANKLLEAKITELERHVEDTRTAIATEQDPAVLSKRNIDWNLGLQPLSATQVLRVSENPVDHLMLKQGRQLLDQGIPRVNFSVALQR